MLPRLFGFGLAALHLGYVEDEAGDVVLAAFHADAVLAHDARAADSVELEILLDLVALAGFKHLPLGRLERRGQIRRQEVTA